MGALKGMREADRPKPISYAEMMALGLAPGKGGVCDPGSHVGLGTASGG
ncbi:hypothetical protein [Methylobacterium phyllostachyos]|nr:hypothetical protein [Methylobacterium phyllostachyos]